MLATPEERQEDTPHIPLIVVRVRAATNEIDRFIGDYCRYFGADILFLPTEGVQPPGRRVRFAFALADDSDVVCGEGVVLRMRRDSGNPERPAGMELRYEVLDEDSQQVVERMLAVRTGRASRPKLPEPPPYVSMSLGEPERQTPVERRPAPTQKVPTFIAEAPEEARLPARRGAVLPANPLAAVSERALGFFVEEAFERMTGPAARWRRTAGVFTAGLTMGIIAVLLLPARRVEPRARPAMRVTSLRPPPEVVKPAVPPVVLQPAVVAPASAATLEIHSSPPGATVAVDDEVRGHTPCTVEVAPGPHRLDLQRPRYSPEHLEVRAPGRVVVPLSRPTAMLRVISNPPGAEVRWRNHSLGTTPLELPSAAYETYALEIERDGHTRHRHVYLKPPDANVQIDF